MVVSSIISVVLGVVVGFGSNSIVAHADNVGVASFTANPTSVVNEVPVTFSWMMRSSYGADIAIICPVGVTIKTIAGAVFPCNTPQSLGVATIGSMSLIINNVSGITQQITATVYPEDSTGADIAADAAEVTLSSASVAQPFVSVTQSATEIASGGQETLAWSGIDIGGANVRLDCSGGVQFYISGSTVPISCGSVVSSTDLAVSGSVSIVAQSLQYATTTVTASILPSIVPGVYDTTHQKVLPFVVDPKAAPTSPAGTLLTSSATTTPSGALFYLTWTTMTAASANLEFICNPALTVFSGSVPLPCNTPTFTPTLATAGTVSLMAQNTSATTQGLSILLQPLDANGTYYGANTQTLLMSVLAPSASTSSIQALTGSNTSTASTTNSSTGTSTPQTSHQTQHLPPALTKCP